MEVNQVVYEGNTLIDLSGDTVTPETLAKGVTAHDKTGAIITGTLEGGSSEVVIVECLNPEVSVDDDNTMTITGTPSIGFYDVATSIMEGGILAVLKVVLEGDGMLHLPFVGVGEGYTLIFATADGQGGTAIGEFVRHADGTETITITIKTSDGGSEEPDYRDQYQRVEYIESAEEGTYPYVITDICANNECGVEVVASFPTMADRIPMGSREDSGTTRFYCVYPLSTSSCYYGFNIGSSISCTTKVNTIYRLQTNFMNSRQAIIYEENGTRKAYGSFTQTLSRHTVPIAIFGYHSAASGQVTSKREYKLYSARLSQGFDVIREYIPCYRKSDGVVGLYEKYTGQFLTTPVGAFTAGPDVEW